MDPEIPLTSNSNSPESQDIECATKEQEENSFTIVTSPENGLRDHSREHKDESYETDSPVTEDRDFIKNEPQPLAEIQRTYRPKTPVCRTTMMKSLHDARLVC